MSQDLFDNPLGTDGFEFVEFTSPDPQALAKVFEAMGFTAVARHRSKNVLRYKQGDIDFILNMEPRGQAAEFRGEHGPSINAMAFRVRDAAKALKGAVERGAREVRGAVGPMELNIPAIEGKVTGLFSKAMTSPDGKIRIPLNESQDDKSQIEEFLHDYKGEGIQHVALGTEDIFATVDRMRAAGVSFQQTPDSYYAGLDARVPDHGEDVARLRERAILIDGAPTRGQGLLLQIFTQNVVGPCFFEIIQRKGNEGCGEGNFKALFESLELDQVRRGVLSLGESLPKT